MSTMHTTGSFDRRLGQRRPQARLGVKRVLLSVDFSRGSERAGLFAKALARYFGAELMVAHALPLGDLQFAPPPEREVQRERLLQVARESMNSFTAELGLKQSGTIAEGDITDVIHQLAAGFHPDLLVISTSGRKGLDLLVLGSVAAEIIRSIRTPVLTVGPNARLDSLTLPARIVCPVDFTPQSLRGAQCAATIAASFGSELVFVNVLDRPRPTSAAQRQHDLAFFKSRLVHRLGAGRLPARTLFQLFHKHPCERIVAAAENVSADLIVLGVKTARRYPRAVSHAPFAIARRVINEASCPVLTVSH
jgi:nucleotide-binding universal stress UspA family protein